MKTDSVRKQKVISDTTYHSLFSNVLKHILSKIFQNVDQVNLHATMATASAKIFFVKMSTIVEMIQMKVKKLVVSI